jgi:hypothetical protein
VANLFNINGNSKEDLPLNLPWVMDLMGVLVNPPGPKKHQKYLRAAFSFSNGSL